MKLFFLFISLNISFSLFAQWDISNENLLNFYKNRDFSKAKEWGLKGILEAEIEFGTNHTNYATIANNLGMVLEELGDYNYADSLYTISLKVTSNTKGVINKDYLVCLQNSIHINLRLGKLEQATIFLEKGIKLANQVFLNPSSDLASWHNSYGMVLLKNNKFQKAEQVFNQALKMCSAFEDTPLELSILNNLASIYEKTNRFNASISILEKELKIADEEKSLDIALIQNNLGMVFFRCGKLEQAENYLKKSIENWQLDENHKNDYFTCLENLVTIYLRLGKYAQAEAIVKKTYAERRKKGKQNPREIAESQLDLVSLYLNTGENTLAESYLQEVQNNINLLPKVGNEDLNAKFLNQSGILNQELGRFTKADADFKQALLIYKGLFGEQHPNYINTICNRATLLASNGKLDLAITILETASQSAEYLYGDLHPDFALILIKCADGYMMQTNFKKAQPYYEKAIEIIRTSLGTLHPSYANCLENLATIYNDNNNYEKAEQFYMESATLLKNIYSENHPDYMRVITNLGFMFQEKNDYENAAKYLEIAADLRLKDIKRNLPLLNENEKLEYVNKNYFFFHNFLTFSVNYAGYNPKVKTNIVNTEFIGDAYNLALSYKNILLSSSQKIRKRIVNSSDTLLIKEFYSWQNLRNRIAHYSNLSVIERSNQNINLGTLQQQAERLQKKLSLKSVDFKDVYNPILPNWKTIKSKLKENECAIEMIRLHQKDSSIYMVLIISPETINAPEVVILKNCSKLENKFYSYYKNHVLYRLEDFQSYDNYWKLINSKIMAINPSIKKIYFSGDGIFRQMSIEVFQNPVTKKYLFEQYIICQLTSTQDIQENNVQLENKRVVLIGNPDFGCVSKKNCITSLPATQEEIDTVASLLKSNNYTVTSFCKLASNEKNCKSIKNPAILHIATHGFFHRKDTNEISESMLQSGLLLAGASLSHIPDSTAEIQDGILTAYEIQNMNLDQTELVVLSACETGLGFNTSSQGVFGLQRALQVAGARFIIMTLWQIDDEVSRYFMCRYYEALIKTHDYRKSLNFARFEVKKSYPQPYFWGAFVMLGI